MKCAENHLRQDCPTTARITPNCAIIVGYLVALPLTEDEVAVKISSGLKINITHIVLKIATTRLPKNFRCSWRPTLVNNFTEKEKHTTKLSTAPSIQSSENSIAPIANTLSAFNITINALTFANSTPIPNSSKSYLRYFPNF